MKRRTEERLLWAVTALGLTIAGAGWLASSGQVSTVAAEHVALTDSMAVAFGSERNMAFSALANRVTEGDPFRADRRPAPLPFSRVPDGLPAPPPPPPAPPKPALVLRGTVGGPTWEALLEGIPGREGSVLVRQGDTLAGFTLRRVSGDTVVVRGMDTTWTLTVKRAWP